MGFIDVNLNLNLFAHEVVDVDIGGLKGLSEAGCIECLEQLKKVVRDHRFDLNFPPDILARARSLLDDDSSDLNWEYLQKLVAEIDAENSFF